MEVHTVYVVKLDDGCWTVTGLMNLATDLGLTSTDAVEMLDAVERELELIHGIVDSNLRRSTDDIIDYLKDDVAKWNRTHDVDDPCDCACHLEGSGMVMVDVTDDTRPGAEFAPCCGCYESEDDDDKWDLRP